MFVPVFLSRFDLQSRISASSRLKCATISVFMSSNADLRSEKSASVLACFRRLAFLPAVVCDRRPAERLVSSSDVQLFGFMA